MAADKSHLRGGKKLSLHIEGVTELSGDVRLSAFIEKLNTLRAALVESDHILSGSKETTLDYLVTGLSHNSPAEVEIEPYRVADTGTDPDAQIDFFVEAVRSVRQHGKAPPRVTNALLSDIKKLTDGIGSAYSRIWVTDSDGRTAPLDAEVNQAIASLLPRTRRAYGSVRGIVKKYNGAGDKLYFQVFLPVGDWRVKCIFPQELLERAREAVERVATIEGYLSYHEGDKWPFEVKVKDLRVHRLDSELPTLSGLIGSAPRATGEMSTGDFLRSLRDGW